MDHPLSNPTVKNWNAEHVVVAFGIGVVVASAIDDHQCSAMALVAMKNMAAATAAAMSDANDEIAVAAAAAAEHPHGRHSRPRFRPRQPLPSQYPLPPYDSVTAVVAGSTADGEDGLECQNLNQY